MLHVNVLSSILKYFLNASRTLRVNVTCHCPCVTSKTVVKKITSLINAEKLSSFLNMNYIPPGGEGLNCVVWH